MDWNEFDTRFTSELKARNYIINLREKLELTCPNCEGNNFRLENKYRRWICRDCKSRICLTTGTVMYMSLLPCLYWLKVIYVFSQYNGIISRNVIDKEIKEHRNKLVTWHMLQKIRSVIHMYIEECPDVFKDYSAPEKFRYKKVSD